MKILCIVQRYGDQIVGGAELHCRLIAEQLAANHSVEIATTCAADYLSWENVFAEGVETIGAIPVHRFPVLQSRPSDFDVLAFKVLHGYPSKTEQKQYLEAHGPVCPDLIRFAQRRHDVDRFILFSYRYWTTLHTLEAIGPRAILVPTAEHDRTLYLSIHKMSFHRPGAIAYNSPEERRLIHNVTGNNHVPGVTVGVGLPDAAPDKTVNPSHFDLPGRYFLYIGRIEEAKGCQRLIADYLLFYEKLKNPPPLVFIGKQEIPVPNHPGLFCLGVQPESVKLALLQQAVALVMPSRYESLSMVVLEAWKMKRPVICNARCDVLRGQCRRSGGGLFYRNVDEFVEVMSLMSDRADLGDAMGEQGHQYYIKTYSWPVIMEKYERLLKSDGDSE